MVSENQMIVIVIVSEIKLVKIYSQILFLILCDSFFTELKVRKRNVIGIHFLLVSSFSQLRRKRCLPFGAKGREKIYFLPKSATP